MRKPTASETRRLVALAEFLNTFREEGADSISFSALYGDAEDASGYPWTLGKELDELMGNLGASLAAKS